MTPFRSSFLQLRYRMQVTQTEMARLLGVGRTCIQNYEYGLRKPKSPRTLERIGTLMIQYPA